MGAARILAYQAGLRKLALPAEAHTVRTAAKGTTFCLEAFMRDLKLDFSNPLFYVRLRRGNQTHKTLHQFSPAVLINLC